jgi:hypothetical protein
MHEMTGDIEICEGTKLVFSGQELRDNLEKLWR